jgi:GT2 family glycosyltransferase
MLLDSTPGRWIAGWTALSFPSRIASPIVYVDTADGTLEWRHPARCPQWSRRPSRVVHLPEAVMSVRVKPASAPGPFEWGEVTMRRVGRFERLGLAVLHVAHLILRYPRSLPGVLRRALDAWRREGLFGIGREMNRALFGDPAPVRNDYRAWARRFDSLCEADRSAVRRLITGLAHAPTISLLMPVEHPREDRLRRAVQSVLGQLYGRWELLVTLAPSTPPELRHCLGELAAGEARMRVQSDAGKAPPITSEFVGRMGAEDVLPEHALFMVADELARHDDADIVYSDEDTIDDAGARADPRFKPEWNPELFGSFNYLGRLAIHRRTLASATDVASPTPDDRLDEDEYATLIRVVARTHASRIRHLPHVLCHRGGDPAASSALAASARPRAADALAAWFASLGSHLEVMPLGEEPGRHRLRAIVPVREPLVSLIVPSRDRRALLEACVESLFAATDYSNVELIVVDNDSREPEAREYLRALSRRSRTRVVRDERPFNFSALANRGARSAEGELLAFVNNDVLVMTRDWLAEMVGHALRPTVGAVGAKLYYPDSTVQHAGIVVGIHGVCGHVHRHRTRAAIGYCSRMRAVQEVSAVTAACLVIRRGVFDRIGGFDEENLPIAFNDIDLCLRLGEQGYRTVWTPWAELYHREGASLGLDHLKSERFALEIAYMKARWRERLAADPCYNPNLSLDDEDFGLAFPPRVTKTWRRGDA